MHTESRCVYLHYIGLRKEYLNKCFPRGVVALPIKKVLQIKLRVDSIPIEMDQI